MIFLSVFAFLEAISLSDTLCRTVKHIKNGSVQERNYACSQKVNVGLRCCNDTKCTSYCENWKNKTLSGGFSKVCEKQANDCEDQKYTYTEAEKICREHDLLLCTSEQLKTRKDKMGCKGTGCLHNLREVWARNDYVSTTNTTLAISTKEPTANGEQSSSSPSTPSRSADSLPLGLIITSSSLVTILVRGQLVERDLAQPSTPLYQAVHSAINQTIAASLGKTLQGSWELKSLNISLATSGDLGKKRRLESSSSHLVVDYVTFVVDRARRELTNFMTGIKYDKRLLAELQTSFRDKEYVVENVSTSRPSARPQAMPVPHHFRAKMITATSTTTQPPDETSTTTLNAHSAPPTISSSTRFLITSITIGIVALLCIFVLWCFRCKRTSTLGPRVPRDLENALPENPMHPSSQKAEHACRCATLQSDATCECKSVLGILGVQRFPSSERWKRALVSDTVNSRPSSVLSSSTRNDNTQAFSSSASGGSSVATLQRVLSTVSFDDGVAAPSRMVRQALKGSEMEFELSSFKRSPRKAVLPLKRNPGSDEAGCCYLCELRVQHTQHREI